MEKDFQVETETYEAPVLRVHGTLEEMTHGGRRGRGPGRPHRPHDPGDYTFS
ncbi:lasso RiPP family leader peptide-containing protein [Rhodobacter sp. NSM]|uniref:lasso RiPP family leader peptide-containing protein n=1 Tax=Rhodobacter sp. NSM TaxID=3457501 RepID=UPI003FD2F506